MTLRLPEDSQSKPCPNFASFELFLNSNSKLHEAIELNYRVYKKKVDKSEIALCFAKRLNIRCFFIKIDCFGTYNLE